MMNAPNLSGSRFRRLFGVLAVALTAAALMPTAAEAQSGEELLQEAMERFEERAQGIENYTVVHEVMGSESSQRYVKQTVDGHTVFVPADQGDATGDMNPYRMFPELVERAQLQGSETVNGTETRVIVVQDLEGTSLMDNLPGQAGQGGQFRPQSLTIWLGTADYLIHRMRVAGTMQRDGESRDVDFTANLTDYRQIEGFYHPFRIEAEVSGLMSPEQRQKLQQLQEQLKSMPEAQREQMKKMLGPQLDALGSGQFVLTVKDFRVNTSAEGGSGS